MTKEELLVKLIKEDKITIEELLILTETKIEYKIIPYQYNYNDFTSPMYIPYHYRTTYY